MTHTTSFVPDSEKSKIIARAIQKRFDELNSPIKLNHAYEALALAHNYPNWATMKGLQPSSKVVSISPGSFTLGRSRSDEDQWTGIELSHEDSLRHFHCFATTAPARQRVLGRLGLNAIQQGSSAVFVQLVTDDDSKAETMNAIMSDVSGVGRRRDYFVLDLSSSSSRVGNTCNILHGEDDPDACASLFLSEGYRNSAELEIAARRFISDCARNVLGRGDPLSAERIACELRKLDESGFREEWLELYGQNYKALTLGLAVSLAVHVESFAQRYKRFFDQTSVWEGLTSIFARPQVLAVFLSENPGAVEKQLQEMFYRALSKAVASSHRSAVPDMLLLNDISLLALRSDFVQAATTGRVCIVVADQCPSAPVQFEEGCIEFRSVDYKREIDYHFLMENGVEVHVIVGPDKLVNRSRNADGALSKEPKVRRYLSGC